QGVTAGNTLSFQDNSSTLDTGFVNADVVGISYTSTWCCHKLRRTFYMPYFQDEWKVTPTLTLNLGLRWEYYGVAHEADNQTTVFDVNQFHGVCLGSGSTNGPFPTPINTPTCPTNPALYNPNYKNFDPRVSLAWAPSALNGKTVVRAGFGIYHGAAQNDDLNAGLESDTFRIKTTTAVTLNPAFEQTTPDLSSISTTKAGSHPRALQRQDRRDLYAETWGLTIEHTLPANFLFSTQYLGSRGLRLFSRGAVNLCTEPLTINSSNSFGADCVRTLDQYYPGGNPFSSV